MYMDWMGNIDKIQLDDVQNYVELFFAKKYFIGF